MKNLPFRDATGRQSFFDHLFFIFSVIVTCGGLPGGFGAHVNCIVSQTVKLGTLVFRWYRRSIVGSILTLQGRRAEDGGADELTAVESYWRRLGAVQSCRVLRGQQSTGGHTSQRSDFSFITRRVRQTNVSGICTQLLAHPT